MKINNLVRQLQIDLITDTPNPIIDWFNGIWTMMHVIETDVYHKDMNELIYYNIIYGKKEWIFYQDSKNERFWCNYKNYWSIMTSRFDLTYDEVQKITRILVENALNNNITKPLKQKFRLLQKVDNVINNAVIPMPRNEGLDFYNSVDNALITHVHSLKTQDLIIENSLNKSIKNINIDRLRDNKTWIRVENALNKDGK